MSQCNLLEVESRISSESIWKHIVFQEKYYSVFSVFGLNTSSARIRKNTDQKKLLFEHFSHKRQSNLRFVALIQQFEFYYFQNGKTGSSKYLRSQAKVHSSQLMIFFMSNIAITQFVVITQFRFNHKDSCQLSAAGFYIIDIRLKMTSVNVYRK